MVCAGMTTRTSALRAIGPSGCAVTMAVRAPGCAGDVDEEPTGGEVASAGSDDEQIAGTDRRSRHVANHMGVAAHVEQPHRKALDGQPLAAGTVQGDAARRLDLVDQGIGSIVGHAREDRANIGKGRRAEGPQGLPSSGSLHSSAPQRPTCESLASGQRRKGRG